MPTSLTAYSAAEAAVRNAITQMMVRALGESVDASLIEIDYTPNTTFGDFTVPCFPFAKALQKSPNEIAETLVATMSLGGILDKAVAAGPYVNFYIDRAEFSRLALTEIHKAKETFGRSKIGGNEKVMVEFFSPNTNKPLTIGHVRNICLGWSVSRLLQASGHKVVTATLYNDRGIALAKTILGYKKWGKDKSPQDVKQKSDHFVGNFYVKFAQAEKEDANLEHEAQRTLQAWEEDKKDVKDIWLKLITWVLDGFRETLNRLRVGTFDEEYHESEYYREGKTIIEKGLKRGVFKRHTEGYVYAELEPELPNKILLRSDGTSLYITQDIYLASLKNRHQVKKSIIVSGSEQELQFKQLFKILALLEFENLKNNYHLSYGMIRLPDGKIKSREGLAKGTGADDLLDELEALAVVEIKKRETELSDEETKKRAADIALGALKFYILDVNPKTTMTFSPEKSIAFTGRTGPYLQYVHARICSIFEKAGSRLSPKVDVSVLNHELEFELIKRLSRFPSVVATAALTYDPSHLANYLADVAKIFSSFYEHVPILKSEGDVKKARLLLVHDVRTVLANGLNLLGIPAPEKM